MTVNQKRWAILAMGVGVAWLAVAVGRHTPALSDTVPAYRRLGPAGARVWVREYSDLQCPKCAHAWPHVKALLAAYPKDVRLTFHHAPLKNHAWAALAAQAAEAAGLQGKFWEYAEFVFSKQEEWAKVPDPKPLFHKYAQELGLDGPRFAGDMDSPSIVDLVRREKAQADAISIPATPTFYINDRMLVGDTQLAGHGARYVELELAR